MERVYIQGTRAAAIIHDDSLDLLNAQLGSAVTVGEGHGRETVVDLPGLQE